MQFRSVSIDRDSVLPVQGWSLLQPICEILIIVAIPLLAVWVAPVFIHERPALARTIGAMALMGLLAAIGINRYHNESPRQIGLRLDNFLEAGRPLAWFTVIGAIAILALGWRFGSIHLGKRFVNQLLVLPVWGIEQQYGVQAIINRRCQTMFGKGWRSVLLTALLFSALHLPNPILVLATFASGLAWAVVYQRAPNLPALALSHAFLSAILANSLPIWLLPNMKVGWGYW